MTQTDPHRSLSRALDILELCSSSPGGYTLSQLSVRLSISKGSISPLLHTLRQRGYLLLDGTTRCYRIGSMAFHVGNSYLDGSNLMEEIQRLMEGIVADCGETCHLGSLKSGDVFYLKKVESPPAQPHRHRCGPDPARLFHRHRQGPAGRLHAAPAQGPVL